jgi:hypothetical protein
MPYSSPSALNKNPTGKWARVVLGTVRVSGRSGFCWKYANAMLFWLEIRRYNVFVLVFIEGSG